MEWVYWLIFVLISIAWVVLMILIDKRDSRDRIKSKDLRKDIDICQTKLVELINLTNSLSAEVKRIEGDIYEET